MPATDRPPTPAHNREQLARLDTDLAAARLRRKKLDYQWGHAMYTAGCRRSSRELHAGLVDVDATIAELEASREALVGTPQGTRAVLAAPELGAPASKG